MREARGSERILDRLGEPDTIADDALKAIVDIVRENDMELIDWCQLGQPRIDAVSISALIAPERTGEVVQQLLDIPGWACRLDVFPRGITNPEVTQLNIAGGTLAALGR
jgi:hypothetical protein